MSTSGGFVPAVVPECPYSPRMTRAAALALRAAGGLRENCVIVITDGPTIGAAPNTSPTEIELNPVSTTELGTTARVHTTFDNSAWSGIYDIDLGTAGTITSLTDNRNNTVDDVDADAPTVHTQFPWGSPANLRDNYVNDMLLPNWANLTAADAIQDTKIIGGNATGTFDLGGSGTVALNGCEIIQGGATFARTGNCALSWSRLRTTFFTATLNGAGGGLTFFDSELHIPNFQRAAAANTTSTITAVTGEGLVANLTGPGPLSLSNLIVGGATVTIAAGAVRGLSITGGVLAGASVVNQQRTLAGPADFIQNSTILGNSTVTLTGAAGAAPAITPVIGSRFDGQSVVTLTDPSQTMIRTTEVMAATVNASGTGQFVGSRVAAGAVVNPATFAVTNSIVDGPFTKTATAANTGKLVNAGFDNWI